MEMDLTLCNYLLCRKHLEHLHQRHNQSHWPIHKKEFLDSNEVLPCNNFFELLHWLYKLRRHCILQVLNHKILGCKEQVSH